MDDRIASFVDGEWIACDESGNATTASIDAAVASAKSCDWGAFLSSLVEQGKLVNGCDEVAQRYQVIQKVIEAMEDRCDEFAHLDAEETGVPFFIAKQITLGYGPAARAFVESAFTFLKSLTSERIAGRYGQPIVRSCRPNSPALLIAPWNVPFGTILPKLFVAWLCGCSVIIKPSEFAFRGICGMIKKLVGSGWLPHNAVQVIVGGPSVGQSLTSRNDIACVQFTGSSPTAFKVAAVCAQHLRPFHAECGGSNAAIVSRSADLDLAARCLAMGITTLNGQWCMGLTRIFVHREVERDFLQKLCSYINDHVKVVCPTDHDVVPEDEECILVGRLAFAAHAETLSRLCTACQPEAEILVGEFNTERFKDDVRYFQPRILLHPDAEVISKQELFGPVSGVLLFDTLDEAIDLANRAAGQLASYIFDKDVQNMYRIAPRLHTGMVMINSVNFCFEVAEGEAEPRVDFVGTAGHGADGNGETLAAFFTSSMWVGVNGPQTS